MKKFRFVLVVAAFLLVAGAVAEEYVPAKYSDLVSVAVLVGIGYACYLYFKNRRGAMRLLSDMSPEKAAKRFRRQWPRLADRLQLSKEVAPRDPNDNRTDAPDIVRMETSDAGFLVEFQPLLGQSAGTFENAIPALESALGASVRMASPSRPGFAAVQVLLSDPLEGVERGRL